MKHVRKIVLLAAFAGGLSTSSYADNVTIGCKQHSNKVVGFGDQTAVCSDCTDVAAATHAYFKGDDTRITHQEGHHNEVGCSLSYEDPFDFVVKTDIPGVGEQAFTIEVFKKVCVHGRAKATHQGETARIDCKAQVSRNRIK